MRNLIKLQLIFAVLIGTESAVSGHTGELGDYKQKPILTDIATIKAMGLPLLAKDEVSGVGYTIITPEMEYRISTVNHRLNKCGGFEALPENEAFNSKFLFNELENLAKHVQKQNQYSQLSFRQTQIQKNSIIEQALQKVDESHLEQWIRWLSSYDTRFNRGKAPNRHVDELYNRLQSELAPFAQYVTISKIDHQSTPQKSLRVRIEGSSRANETVVLGGHLDSISGFMGTSKAPGADDNASGSSNLLQAMSIVLQTGRPERSVEFFWYAGEESGLLGSAEIAKTYKAEGRNVVAVLQLDMTLFPGDGEFVMGSMTDFTSTWLRDYLEELNRLYLGGRIVYDKCGYGCSDHASWFRQGFPTVMPFEASFNSMNSNIHTPRDLVDSQSSFRHSAMFSKLAVAFALDLGNSTAAQPY